jgi:hypothetical protein
MKMYLTMCDIHYKISQKGEEYGFSQTCFCTVESFWDKNVFDEAANFDDNEAVMKITEQILFLNPTARKDRIVKFR